MNVEWHQGEGEDKQMHCIYTTFCGLGLARYQRMMIHEVRVGERKDERNIDPYQNHTHLALYLLVRLFINVIGRQAVYLEFVSRPPVAYLDHATFCSCALLEPCFKRIGLFCGNLETTSLLCSG